MRGYGPKVTLGPTDDKPMLVCGVMAYSPTGETVLLCDRDAIGMPINVKWLKQTGATNHDTAKEYRDRYEAQFPGQLKPF